MAAQVVDQHFQVQLCSASSLLLILHWFYYRYSYAYGYDVIAVWHLSKPNMSSSCWLHPSRVLLLMPCPAITRMPSILFSLRRPTYQQPSQRLCWICWLSPGQFGALDRAVEFYFWNSLAASTRSAYGSAKSHYTKFCISNGLSPLPASEHQLCQFVSCLVNQNLCHSTMKCYPSAVRHLHVAGGAWGPKY